MWLPVHISRTGICIRRTVGITPSLMNFQALLTSRPEGLGIATLEPSVGCRPNQHSSRITLVYQRAKFNWLTRIAESFISYDVDPAAFSQTPKVP